jgi:hypothetical protein
MLWQVGVDDTSLDPVLTSITAGSGFTLLTANREAGLVSQWNTSAASGANTCTFTTSGSDTWQSICMAFQTATAGTAPTGMYIAHAAGEWLGETGTTPHTMQFPSQGNLIVGVLDDYQTSFSAMSSSPSNTWNMGTETLNTGSSAQIFFAPNATTSSTMTLSPTYNTNETQGLNFIQWFDIVGAPTSPYDTAHGTKGTAGTTTLTTDVITPSAANEFVFNVTSVYYGTGLGTTTIGALYSYAWDTWDSNSPGTPSSWEGNYTAPSHLQDDSPRAIIISTGSNPITFTYSMTASATNWASTSMAFLSSTTPQAATPTFSPISGTVSSTPISVTISDSTMGSSITYCFNTNTCTPSTSYSSPVTVSSTGYLCAQATASGFTPSAIGCAQYTIGSTGPLWGGILDPAHGIDWTQVGAPNLYPGRTCNGSPIAPTSACATINNAIQSAPANSAVCLAAGTFNLSCAVTFNGKSNVTLRGAGADQTFLVFTGAGTNCGLTSGSNVCIFNNDGSYYASPSNVATWSASSYPKGTNQATLTVTTGSIGNLKPGGLLFLDQLTDETGIASNISVTTRQTVTPTCTTCCTTSVRHNGAGCGDACTVANNCRPQFQIVTVNSVSGNTVTFTPGIYMPNWRSSQQPGAWWMTTAPITGDGIENLSIDSTSSTAYNAITIHNGYGNWVKGIRSVDPMNKHVIVWTSAHNTIRDSYFYMTQGSLTTSGDEYGIDNYTDSDTLVENNIFQAMAGPIRHETCEGCVDGYNFSIFDAYTGCNPTPPYNCTWGQPSDEGHATGNMYILAEGNDGYGLHLDRIHGVSLMITAFRNRYWGYETTMTSGVGHTIPAYSYGWSRYHHWIGNVLGYSGYHTQYQAIAGNLGSSCNESIYAFGLGADCGSSNIDDTFNVTSSMRWGNWDVVNNATRFVSSEVPSGITNYPNPVPGTDTLPPSFYHSSQPSWWPAGKPWPPIGPDVTGGNIANSGGHAYTIPAKDCYLNVMHGPADGTGSVLSFNATTCYPAGPQVPGAPTGLTATVI